MFSIRNISKSFPGVKALDDISFDIQKGEVHAVIGENGAGKSTLMKIMMGILPADSGQMLIKGKEINIDRPRDSLDLGISMVFQEIILIPTISVAENVFVGFLPTKNRGITVDYKKLYRETAAILKKIDLDIAPKETVSNLTSGQKQLIQLAKATVSKPKMVIMDEPSASLSSEETKVLFNLISELKDAGVAIVYISHRLEEIFQIADRVTILRDGKYIDTVAADSVTKNDLISLMVGRYVDIMYTHREHDIGEEILKVSHLSKQGMFDDINFDLHAGQIMGIYGLVGAGRTELAMALFGVFSDVSGDIWVEGKKVKPRSPRAAIKHGIMYLPEERKEQSIIPLMNIRENITISNLSEYSSLGVPQERREVEICQEYQDKMRIKTTSLKQLIMNLSGGNQQKVTLSRLMALNPKIMILDEPTRGIDIGAKAEIHDIISQLAANGMAIIVISSDLPEVMAIADDVYTMAYGQITGQFPNHNHLTQEEVLKSACIA